MSAQDSTKNVSPTREELRPTHLEVNLARLRENYQVIASHVAPARVMPVLKANAYAARACR